MTAPMDGPILDVVIIGGGLAGVRTALGLHDAGRSFVLLEANDRLGGRVKTLRDPALPAAPSTSVHVRSARDTDAHSG